MPPLVLTMILTSLHWLGLAPWRSLRHTGCELLLQPDEPITAK